MDRYNIMLGKDPPPCAEPPKKKTPKKKDRQETREETAGQAGQPSIGLDQAARESILSRYLQTANGRARLAASMVNPLRQRLDYSSVARRAFAVEPLPEGAFPVYNVDQPAYAVDSTRSVLELPIMRGRTVSVPMFEIHSNPQIPLTQIRERRYNLIDRVHALAVNQIRSGEEEMIFMVLEALSNIREENFTTDLTTDETLRDAFESMEYGTENILMSAHVFGTIRRLYRSQLEPRNRTEITDSAVNLWGVPISISRQCPPNQIYLLARPELVGRLPIRGFNVFDTSDPRAMVGWNVTESVGAVGFNPNAVTRVTVL